ncbi:F-box family protein [Actinidia rufa]|uniref:F-box family protein n=1 Tax=Actinidia rufa TaxID=165716 RepID=A0A7J0H3Y1_9ERIC|nr:F-box family protein [Actinidia rufa]
MFARRHGDLGRTSGSNPDPYPDPAGRPDASLRPVRIVPAPLSLSSDDCLWQRICHSTWPSIADPRLQRLISAFPSGHLSFYSDAFPALQPTTQPHHSRPPPSSAVVSAVDIRYHNKLILSKIHDTETESAWFLCSPFRVDLLDPKETVPSPVKFQSGDDTCLSDLEDNLTLSWIVIDPTRNRAANFSSLRPVSVTHHWLTGDVQVRTRWRTGERRIEKIGEGEREVRGVLEYEERDKREEAEEREEVGYGVHRHCGHHFLGIDGVSV